MISHILGTYILQMNRHLQNQLCEFPRTSKLYSQDPKPGDLALKSLSLFLCYHC